MTEFSKGKERTGGRAKGTPNKITGDIKAMIVSAFHKAGGEEYLIKQAKENPKAFLTLLSKTIPSENKTQISTDLGIAEQLRRAEERIYGSLK